MAVFEEVDDVQADARAMNRLVFDRHAVRYRAAIEWVRWILALLSPAVRAGENTAPGLLFDMNRLFESAVASVLRQWARHGVSIDVQSRESPRYLASVRGGGSRREFRLKPDLLVREGTDVVSIADTKWKRLEVRKSGYLRPSEADIYQMHAYAAAYQCERLALIYPWHNGLTGSKETILELPQIGTLRPEVSVVCVDLRTDAFATRTGEVSSGLSMPLSLGPNPIATAVSSLPSGG